PSAASRYQDMILFDKQGNIVQFPRDSLMGMALLSHDPRLFLRDGKFAPLPTYHAGTIRIQARPSPGAKRVAGKVELFLDILPEPSVSWLGVSQLQISKA